MNPAPSLLSVVTVSHVAQAVVMLRSARRHGTYSSFRLFVTDAPPETVVNVRRALGDDDGWIQVFGPHDLGPERDGFLAVFSHYNRKELSAFGKFVGVSHVLRDPSAGETCVFADADTLFLGGVDEAVHEMGAHVVLLTPHYLGPSCDDVEHGTMLHGWLNTGFLAFRRGHPGTRSVLDWLIDRNSRRGYFAPQYGLSADQTWASALPFLFRDLTFVSWHPGLNVGYWNLHERPLTRPGKQILAGGCPLLLFHFSAYVGTRAGRLTKHSAQPIPRGSPLADLCQFYESELDDVAGLQSAIATFSTLPCSTAPLIERMHAGYVRTGANIVNPDCRLGLFTRLGGNVDSVVRRTMAWRSR